MNTKYNTLGEIMNEQLYYKLCQSLLNVFTTADFKYIDKQNAYCITCNSDNLLPWIARNISFTKDEKLLILNLIKINNIFFNNGPKWYCKYNDYLTTINELLLNTEFPLEETIAYKPISAYMRNNYSNGEWNNGIYTKISYDSGYENPYVLNIQ